MTSLELLKRSRKMWILFAMMLCTGLVFLESTIFPVALPTIQKQMKMSQSGLYWTINIYLLVMASFVYAAGKLSDQLGHRLIFITGLNVFGIASICGALSVATWQILVSRAILGLGSSLMLPSSMSITLATLSERQRGKGIGFLVAVGSIFLSIGPFLGGFFTEYFTWRLCFWVNLPFVIICMAITFLAVPKFQLIRKKFGILGFLAYVALIVSMILSIMDIIGKSGFSFVTAGFLAIFVTLLLLIIRHVKKHQNFFFNYALLKNKKFSTTLSTIFIIQTLMMIPVFWSLFFQKILGFSPVTSGLYLLITTLPIIVVAPLSGTVADKLGPRWPVCLGFSFTAFAFLLLLFYGFTHSNVTTVTILLIFGSGVSLVMTPGSSTAMSSVESSKRGEASGIYTTSRNIASTLSVAVFGSLIAFFVQSRFKSLMKGTDVLKPEQFKPIVLEYLQGGVSAISKLEAKDLIIKKVNQASIYAFDVINMICLVLSLLGVYIAFTKLKGYKPIKVSK